MVALISIFAFGCSSDSDPNAIDLQVALEKTESGEYNLVATTQNAEFISFQKNADHKRQFYYKEADRTTSLKKVVEAIKNARSNGHSIATMGFDKYLDE